MIARRARRQGEALWQSGSIPGSEATHGTSPDALACRAGGSDEADLSQIQAFSGENERRNGLPEASQPLFLAKAKGSMPAGFRKTVRSK
jgi:hypothetical protein